MDKRASIIDAIIGGAILSGFGAFIFAAATLVYAV